MGSKYSLNTSGLGSVGVAIAKVSTLIAVPAVAWGAVIFAETESEGTRENVEQVLQSSAAPVVVGPGQVALDRGGLKYVFDFEAGLVLVEKGAFTTSTKFHDFRSQELLDVVRAKGCGQGASGRPALGKHVCQ